jgi:probable DNA metabolism protein
MLVFRYDKSFEGLLTAVFDGYTRREFPDLLLGEADMPPLFFDEIADIYTDTEKSTRVWNGLKKRMSETALYMLPEVWLSELPEVDMLLFRYIRKTFDSKQSIELNFGDPDVMELTKIWKHVSKERLRVIQFVRFQQTSDDIFFACIEPEYNVIPLVLNHFTDRFHDQRWLIYDSKRDFGFFYDLKKPVEVHLDGKQWDGNGCLNDQSAAEDEKLYQKLWQGYYSSMTIKERINPRLHRQNLPVRFWKFLPEKRK